MSQRGGGASGEPRLSRRSIFFYGLADLPVMMAVTPLIVFLPNYYTSDLKLDLAAVANVILVTRLLDLLIDPLIGRLSDMTRSRWGRRRPWVLASAPILTLCFYRLFVPPADAGLWYLAGWMMAMWIGWSMLLIPYYAWAAELTPNYHERSVVTGWRSMVGVIGQLLAQVLPAVALAGFGYGGTGETMRMVGYMLLALVPLCVLLTVTQVGERRHFVRSVLPVGRGLRLMWTNGPFVRLVLAFLLSFMALGLVSTLFLYYVRQVVQEPKAGIYMLTVVYVCNLLGVPLWVWLSRRIGKHRAWIASFVLISVALPFYMLLGPGDFWWMVPVSIAAGTAAGAFAALPNSMKADVIDYDALRSGEDRAAIYFSVWSVVQKASVSLSSWLALMGLAWVGLDPKVTTNGPDEILGLKLMISFGPSALFLAAAVIAWRYPITEAAQAEMRAELDRRRAVSPSLAE
ncbi:MAG: MFS transporter [Alphaproteobacteria bacterium]|nr:MFS transporter [Alphaproteobacteria bacterium]